MDISRLIALVPPPENPPAPIDWQASEAVLGPLPSDYKSLINTYGAGMFFGDLGFWAPKDIAQQNDPTFASVLHGYAAGGPHEPSVPGGADVDLVAGASSDTYLPWGGASGGQTGFWRTTNPDPDTWPVIAADFPFLDYEADGIVAFLVGLFDGTVPSVAFGADWLAQCRQTGAAAFERFN